MNDATVAAVADALLAAHAGGSALAPITEWLPGFDVPTAYRVLHEIERRRVRDGWRPVGRKIGFTNRTLWPRYGVYQPMWAHTWRETVQHAPDGHAVVSLTRMVEPRIEPEVVFGLRAALVVGPRLPLADADRDRLASLLPAFALTLRNGERVVDRGTGSNVLDGPAHALVHLRARAGRPTPSRAARRRRVRDDGDDHRCLAGDAGGNVVERLRHARPAASHPADFRLAAEELDVISETHESGSTVVPAPAGTRWRAFASEEPKPLGSRLRGNDESNHAAAACKTTTTS